MDRGGEVVGGHDGVKVTWVEWPEASKRAAQESSNGWHGCSVSHSESPLTTATTLIANISGDSTSRRRKRRLNVRSSGLEPTGLGSWFFRLKGLWALL